MALEVTTMARKRREFLEEFKLETVNLVKEGPRSVGEVARDLDLTGSAVRNFAIGCASSTWTLACARA